MWRIGLGIVGWVLVMAFPGWGTTLEAPPELQGRRNPYRPLIGEIRLPEVPAADPMPAPVPLPEKTPASAFERLEYVGIAYDEAEAIAAVSNGERTWFVRLGDRFEGASLSSITPQTLTWNRNGRLIVKRLRR